MKKGNKYRLFWLKLKAKRKQLKLRKKEQILANCQKKHKAFTKKAFLTHVFQENIFKKQSYYGKKQVVQYILQSLFDINNQSSLNTKIKKTPKPLCKLWREHNLTVIQENLNKKFMKTAMMAGLGFGLLLPFNNAFAMPQDGQIVGGQGSIQQNGTQMDINQQSNRMAIDWTSFNIAQNEAVRFNQPNADAVSIKSCFR